MRAAFDRPAAQQPPGARRTATPGRRSTAFHPPHSATGLTCSGTLAPCQLGGGCSWPRATTEQLGIGRWTSGSLHRVRAGLRTQPLPLQPERSAEKGSIARGRWKVRARAGSVDDATPALTPDRPRPGHTRATRRTCSPTRALPSAIPASILWPRQRSRHAPRNLGVAAQA